MTTIELPEAGEPDYLNGVGVSVDRYFIPWESLDDWLQSQSRFVSALVKAKEIRDSEKKAEEARVEEAAKIACKGYYEATSIPYWEWSDGNEADHNRWRASVKALLGAIDEGLV